MKMDGIRQQLFIDYMYYLNETDRFYATKARYVKEAGKTGILAMGKYGKITSRGFLQT